MLLRLSPEETVTVVGARRASTYGREVARELGRELASAGLVVVSGLAFGIDACAHRGALDGGLTVAVLGCGADVAYPAAHRSLWRRVGEDGLVLSELPPGCGAWRWAFPARNRIMAALSGMTVVVEAAERSGSLITADLAADLGRDLGAVPGPVGSRLSVAPNNLLAGGACLVRDAQDVLDAMLGPGARRIERAGPELGPSGPSSGRWIPPAAPATPSPPTSGSPEPRPPRSRRPRAARLPRLLAGRRLHPHDPATPGERVGAGEGRRDTMQRFSFDRADAERSLTDPDGALWPVNAYSDADEFDSLVQAALDSGAIVAAEHRARLYIYPLSISEPDPLLAVDAGRGPTVLGHSLRLLDREGESPIDFTLRLLEEVADEANVLADEARSPFPRAGASPVPEMSLRCPDCCSEDTEIDPGGASLRCGNCGAFFDREKLW